MLTSTGSAEKIQQGRQTIMWAIIGYAIAGLAAGIAGLVKTQLNI